MNDKNPRDKSCTPQHFPTGHPTTEWTPEEFSAYAQAQHHGIMDDEQKLAVKYWRLGLALNLLRKNFDRGQWEQWLGEMNVEKTKASRARAIARTFDEEEDVVGLTVKQAYYKRVRKQRKPSSRGSEREVEPNRLGRFLNHVTKTADLFVDDAGFAEEAEAGALLPAVDAAIAKLDLLRQQSHKSER